jgi:hypothetical protein
MTNIVEYYLLGCNAMQFYGRSSTFWRNVLPPSLGQKSNPIKKPAGRSAFHLLLAGFMFGLLFDPEVGYDSSSETLVNFYWTAWNYIPEGCINCSGKLNCNVANIVCDVCHWL